MPEKLSVLFLSPEAVPYAKTGGLADVAGALPKSLKRLGLDVRLVLPYYREVREKAFKTRVLTEKLSVPLGKQKFSAQVLEVVTKDGLPVYFIDREDLYDRPNLYGNTEGDYYDNLERYAFFSHAALLLAEELSFRPDIIHGHDWQTGLVPALLKGPYRRNWHLAGTPSVFTIHNIGYQGIFPEEKLSLTGLVPSETFHPEGLEYWGKISLLKAGIVYADAITTVSPEYSREIQTPQYGMGMEGILKHRKAFLRGILNGVDYGQWSPALDQQISANYSPNRLEGKQICKNALMQEMRLDRKLMKKPLLGMVTRLDTQKGLDLLLDILEDVLALDLTLIILGEGDDEIRQALKSAAGRHTGKLGLFLGFDDPLAHRIMAGADIFLIPSRYEPCGLTQMYALKYGTVPLVRATGGLEDTVVPFDPSTKGGTGFKFGPYDSRAFLHAVQEAVRLFENRGTWKRLRANGMQADFSWDRSAREYLALYRNVTGREDRHPSKSGKNIQ